MDAPGLIPLDSTLTQLKVRMVAHTSSMETGGASIDSYHLELYNGLAWVTVSGGGLLDPSSYSTSIEVLVDGLTGGSIYKFRS